MGLADAVLGQKVIDPRQRELACLAVTAVFDVPFIKYAHDRLAVQVGLSQEQVAAATKGETSKDLTHTEAVVYTTALKLARARGPLESWREVEGDLGKNGAARLGHVVAWFVYDCTLLNSGAIDVPEH